MAYPPVDVDFYTPGDLTRRESYLVVSAFAPYKRIDLAIKTFNKLGKPLVIAGSGEDSARLKAMAGPQTVFEGAVSGERLRELYRNARALIFPGVEDFGITPVEAMACGAPVIAYGKGGALETVIPLRDELAPTPTGVYFDTQTVEGLAGAVKRFEENEQKFDPASLRKNALKFAKPVFKQKMRETIDDFLSTRHQA